MKKFQIVMSLKKKRLMHMISLLDFKIYVIKNTISLVRGHNYPESEIRNGFGWEFDNTPMEYDELCENWEFYNIDNGMMLNCYPEDIIYKDTKFLKMIKDY